MSIRRAKSAEEYIEWVKQAVFEMNELKACLEFEADDLSRYPAYVEPLEEGIKSLYQAMREGRYQFGREDLSFIPIALRFGDEIPFHLLLKQINETHRQGIDVQDA